MNYKTHLNHIIKFCFAIFFFSILFIGCSKKDSNGGGTTPLPPPPAPPPSKEVTTPSPEVFMQAFYWDVEPRGGWWDLLDTKLDAWKTAGITAIWLPVISKGQSGAFSMGYDPYDYFDSGQYNQMGTVETRFGSASELTSLITNAKAKGFKLIADIVINHNSGGDLEFSPYSGKSYYTKFNPLSGKFNRSYEDFHPSGVDTKDEDIFGGFPDLCHNVNNVKDWLWKRADGVGKYYKNTLGFDGWRFDFVKGFSPNVVKDWNAEVGGAFSIGEYFDGNVTLVNKWCSDANSGAFDFPLYFAMKDAFFFGNMLALDGKGLIAINPSRAYTFVSNHDIERDPGNMNAVAKLKAYAYILTAEGTPFIFYTDYESILDKAKLNILINIKKTLAAGTTTKLYGSATEYIIRRNGTPGLVAYFNNGSTAEQRKIQTVWANTVLKDYTGAHPDVTTDASGYATISCKEYSYSVYSKK
ncbi:MAG: alpha-amylase domain-containing protein [Chitinophagaceae bacterium]